MPIDLFDDRHLYDLAPRAINPLLRKAITCLSQSKMQEAIDAFTCLIDDAPAEAAHIDRS